MAHVFATSERGKFSLSYEASLPHQPAKKKSANRNPICMQSHALTAESPCVWVENRRRDFNGTRIHRNHSVSFEYHYRGEMRGNFSILVTRLRPVVNSHVYLASSRKKSKKKSWCYRPTMSASRSRTSGFSAGDRSEKFFYKLFRGEKEQKRKFITCHKCSPERPLNAVAGKLCRFPDPNPITFDGLGSSAEFPNRARWKKCSKKSLVMGNRI